MRSTKNKTEFFKKMKKKPALQQILNNLEHYTTEDIQKTNQPKWIKEELKKLKINENSLNNGQKLADLMIQNSPLPVKQELKVYRYVGQTKYIENTEIIENELVVIINDKIVKFSNVEKNKSLFSPTELVFMKKINNMQEYVALFNEDISKRLEYNESEQKPLFTIRKIE